MSRADKSIDMLIEEFIEKGGKIQHPTHKDNAYYAKSFKKSARHSRDRRIFKESTTETQD